MSEHLNLDAIVHARFRDEFGNPHDSLHEGEHWALRAVPGAITINVLVNGTRDGPSVWVFDPYDHSNGLMNVTIRQTRDVDDVIEQIHQRLTSVRQRPRRTLGQIQDAFGQAADVAAAVQARLAEDAQRASADETKPTPHSKE